MKDKKLNRKEFVQYYADTMHETAAEKVEIAWGEDMDSTDIVVTGPAPDSLEYRLYAGNHYLRYLDNPADLEEIVDSAVQAVVNIWEEPQKEISRDMIFPTIKPLSYIDEFRERVSANNQNPDKMIKIRPLAGDLMVFYVCDLGSSYKNISDEDCQKLGIASDNELFELAVDNLSNYIRENQNLGFQQSDSNSLHLLTLDDVLDASLLLLLEKILELGEFEFAKNVVIGVPSRDCLLICDANDESALAQMQQIIDDNMENSPYSISPELYRLENGQIRLLHQH
ncbi:DUF1444 family protein [Neisseriaceae bacterium B1]